MTPPLRVELVAEDGAPFAGLEVELIDSKGRAVKALTRCVDAVKLGAESLVERFRIPMVLQRETSDERGRVVFLAPENESGLVMRISGPGARASVQPLEVGGADEKEVYRVTLPSPGSLVCKFEDLPPIMPACSILLERRVVTGEAKETRRIPMDPSQPLFIDGLTPGAWSMQLEPLVSASSPNPSVSMPLSEVVIESGVEQDLVIGGFDWSTLELDLQVTIGDQPAQGWVGLYFTKSNQRIANSKPLDEAGRFSVSALLPGSYQFSLSMPSGSDERPRAWEQSRRIKLEAGQPYQESIHFPRRRMRVQITSKDGQPASGLGIKFASGTWYGYVKTDQQGVVDLAFVPTEVVSVTVDNSYAPGGRELLGRAKFAAGQEYLAVDYRMKFRARDPEAKGIHSLLPPTIR